MILDLHQLCQQAIRAAHRAGAIIDSYRDRSVEVGYKPVGDSAASQVVTEVDRRAQQAIIEVLEPTISDYDLALLAEESADDGLRFSKSAFWCVDPLDGTLAFVEKVAGYAVSIALVARDGVPLIGVVYDPVKQDTFHAIRGAGAFRNDQPIAPPAPHPGAPLVLATDRSFEQHRYLVQTRDRLAQISTRLGLNGSGIDFRIGAVMNAIRVLNRPNHCYFKFFRADPGGGSIWDYAATACLFSEAGAIVCDMHGDPLELNRKASSFLNHRGVIFSPTPELAQAIMHLNSCIDTE